MKQDKLLDLLKAELNSIPSKEISIEDCNKIILNIWSLSNKDFKLCLSVLKSLNSKTERVKIFKFNAENFLKKLSGSNGFSHKYGEGIIKSKIKNLYEENIFSEKYLKQITKSIQQIGIGKKLLLTLIPITILLLFFIQTNDTYITCYKSHSWKISKNFFLPDKVYSRSLKQKRWVKQTTVSKDDAYIIDNWSINRCNSSCNIKVVIDFYDTETTSDNITYLLFRNIADDNSCSSCYNVGDIISTDYCLIKEKPNS